MNNIIQVTSKILIFGMSSIISLSVLGFSFYKLTCDIETNEKTIYFSMISSIIGLYMPSPLTSINSISGIIIETQEQKKEQLKNIEIV